MRYYPYYLYPYYWAEDPEEIRHRKIRIILIMILLVLVCLAVWLATYRPPPPPYLRYAVVKVDFHSSYILITCKTGGIVKIYVPNSRLSRQVRCSPGKKIRLPRLGEVTCVDSRYMIMCG